MRAKTVSLAKMNLAILMWGGSTMFAKGVQLPLIHTISGRSLICAASLAVFLLLTGRFEKPKSWRDLGAIVLSGGLLCLHWLTFYQSLRVSTAAIAMISLQTYPVITALIEPFLFKEKLQKVDIFLAVIVFIGIAIVVPNLDVGDSTTKGVVLGVVAGQFFMLRSLITRKYVKVYSGGTMMFWQGLVAGLVLLPFALASPVDTSTIDLSLQLKLLVLFGVLFTAVPHSLFASSLRHLSARTGGVFENLLIFYAATFGYFIHGETVSGRTAIGGAIVLTALICETVRHMREPTQ